MAYIRKRGRQLALVHGEREPQTGNVEQQILFTIYSKAEAFEVPGRAGGGKGARLLEELLRERYPDIRFDWRRIRADIERQLDVLPDLYDYREARLRAAFRPAIVDVAKALVLTDPQELLPSAKVVAQHRHELEFVRELIDWRLDRCDAQEPSEWNTDNPFYWRFTLRGREVPPEVEEIANAYWARRDLDRARAVFGLLCEAFHPYAEGHNYLGLIALERGELDDAEKEFSLTVELGRKLFPKRIAKKDYWRLHETRPYIRGLRNLALTYNRMGRFDSVLAICERLDLECGDTAEADAFRASAYMNTAQFERAAACAARLVGLWPSEGFVAGFALAELGRLPEAKEYFVHAILNHPRAARMLAGTRSKAAPASHVEVEDHNAGVTIDMNLHAYLAKQSRATARFFQRVVQSERMRSLASDVETAAQSWFGDRNAERSHFETFNRLRDRAFAQQVAQELRV